MTTTIETSPATSTPQLFQVAASGDWQGRLRTDIETRGFTFTVAEPEGLGGGDAVDLLRSEVTLGVDERLPGAFHLAVGVEEGDADLLDPVMPRRAQPCGLEVEDGLSGHGAGLLIGDG